MKGLWICLKSSTCKDRVSNGSCWRSTFKICQLFEHFTYSVRKYKIFLRREKHGISLSNLNNNLTNQNMPKWHQRIKHIYNFV